MSWREAAELFFTCYAAALVAFAARVTYKLGFNPDPPDDPGELARWVRRRRWLLFSEFSALPLFATSAVLAADARWLSPVSSVMFALVAGALGFAFFLHALDTVVRRRLGMEARKDG